jgi:hypothetical protein
MKKFIKLERIITKEQLALIEHNMTRRYSRMDTKALLHRFGTNFCGCGEVSTYQAIFDVGDNTTKIEQYCTKCIEKESHIKQPEINVFNFDEFFEAIPAYRETLRQRYEEEESIKNL